MACLVECPSGVNGETFEGSIKENSDGTYDINGDINGEKYKGRFRFGQDGSASCDKDCEIDSKKFGSVKGYKKQGDGWSAKEYTTPDGQRFTGASGCKGFGEFVPKCGFLEKLEASELTAEQGQGTEIQPNGDYEFDHVQRITAPTYSIDDAYSVIGTQDDLFIGSAQEFSKAGRSLII